MKKILRTALLPPQCVLIIGIVTIAGISCVLSRDISFKEFLTEIKNLPFELKEDFIYAFFEIWEEK